MRHTSKVDLAPVRKLHLVNSAAGMVLPAVNLRQHPREQEDSALRLVTPVVNKPKPNWRQQSGAEDSLSDSLRREEKATSKLFDGGSLVMQTY